MPAGPEADQLTESRVGEPRIVSQYPPSIDIYIDGAINLRLTQTGMVKFNAYQDVVNLNQPNETDRVIVARLTMPAQVFVELGTWINKTIQQMVTNGLLQIDQQPSDQRRPDEQTADEPTKP